LQAAVHLAVLQEAEALEVVAVDVVEGLGVGAVEEVDEVVVEEGGDFEPQRVHQIQLLRWAHLCMPAKEKWLFAALMKRFRTLMLVST
jgi:hypothetical protein